MKTAEEIIEDKSELILHLVRCGIFPKHAVLGFMNDFASQKVAERERQIGGLLDQMLDEDHPKAFHKAVIQIRKFLYPTCADIAQVKQLPTLVNK